MPTAIDQEINAVLDRYAATLPADLRESFTALYALHTRYRDRAGLSAPLTPERYVVHFVLDSLKLLELGPPPSGATLADIGSGGGYPGLPLALSRPDLAVTLVEPARRKAEYLRLATAALALTNVTVEEGRGEAMSATFDVVTAKGVRPTPAFIAVMLARLRPGGRGVLWLGPGAERGAVAAAAAQAGAAVSWHDYRLPGYDGARTLAVIAGAPGGDVSRET
jgi:16S rRNA (guanine527-N7)-methyltransferase